MSQPCHRQVTGFSLGLFSLPNRSSFMPLPPKEILVAQILLHISDLVWNGLVNISTGDPTGTSNAGPKLNTLSIFLSLLHSLSPWMRIPSCLRKIYQLLLPHSHLQSVTNFRWFYLFDISWTCHILIMPLLNWGPLPPAITYLVSWL